MGERRHGHDFDNCPSCQQDREIMRRMMATDDAAPCSVGGAVARVNALDAARKAEAEAVEACIERLRQMAQLAPITSVVQSLKTLDTARDNVRRLSRDGR